MAESGQDQHEPCVEVENDTIQCEGSVAATATATAAAKKIEKGSTACKPAEIAVGVTVKRKFASNLSLVYCA